MILIRRILLAALALMPTIAQAAAPAPAAEAPLRLKPPATPALWKVSDADTVIWLFGTIHVLPKDYAWQNPVLKTAAAQADGLVIETMLERDPASAAALLFKLGKADGLPPLSERVPPEKRDALARMVARSSLSPAFLDGLETWAAALMLVAVSLEDLGASAGSGVEEVVERDFKAMRKPVSGLESPEEQLGFLDMLPEAEQRAFLVTLLDDPKAAKAEYEAMLDAWARGDEKAIAATFDDEMEVSPQLRTVLLTDRNRRWADWIARRMAAPGKLFIAVGAGHLAGPGSVQEALIAKGFRVERVQ